MHSLPNKLEQQIQTKDILYIDFSRPGSGSPEGRDRTPRRRPLAEGTHTVLALPVGGLPSYGLFLPVLRR